MSLGKIHSYINEHLNHLEEKGSLKGDEKIMTGIRSPEAGFSERYLLQGCGERGFLRMNSNGYLGLALHPRVMQAEARAVEQYGTGPGAVRFISGTYLPHVELENKLAKFHGRQAAITMSAAYATVMGVLPLLITEDTLVISDALNHNCIINAIRLSHPSSKAVFAHLDMAELDSLLETNSGKYRRVVVVTDGVFSMRGDHAPLHEMVRVCNKHEDAYVEGIITMVDDSHGVGALGERGRGTEELSGAKADILVATLGKALGVNGGYVVSDATVISYIREASAFYNYSNPITPAEAAAASQSLDILDSEEGLRLLMHLRDLAGVLKEGLISLGFETIDGEHPIVPIFIRDTERTSMLVRHLFENNILATGLNYPVVPKGEEEIRLQVCATHTRQDMEYLTGVLKRFL